MALIVEGKMPTCCGLCCECLGGGSDAYYCNRAKRQISEVVPPYDKRMERCPIIGEIPDEHGRLIDADALIKRNRESKGILEEFKGDPKLVNVGYKSVIWEIKDLETAPTILEASE